MKNFYAGYAYLNNSETEISHVEHHNLILVIPFINVVSENYINNIIYKLKIYQENKFSSNFKFTWATCIKDSALGFPATPANVYLGQ